MDEKLRMAFRALACGDNSALAEVIQRAKHIGKLEDYCIKYAKPLGPPSPLTALCAIEDCDRILRWSNCSYCEEHHDTECHSSTLDMIWISHNRQPASCVEYDEDGKGFLESMRVYSCNEYKRHTQGITNDEA